MNSAKTIADNVADKKTHAPHVIFTCDDPLKKDAGFIVMSGNLFNTAVMKTSVLGSEFRKRYLENPQDNNAFEGRAIVFEGPEDYHARINDPSLELDENCILHIVYSRLRNRWLPRICGSC